MTTPSTNPATVAAIGAIIKTAKKLKNAYFWKPSSNADGRRYDEKRYTHPRVEWIEGGHTYAAAYKVQCSCKNFYAWGEYEKDGKKTTLTAIRNSYKRLTEKVEK